MTNATFAEALCGNLTLGTVTQLFIKRSDPAGLLYLLPGCFFLNAGTIVSFNADGIVSYGDGTVHDPLVVLGNVLTKSAPLTFCLSNSFLINPVVSDPSISNYDYNFQIDWTAAFNAMPTLSNFQLANIYLGMSVTLPSSSLPATLTSFVVTSCHLTGNIPPALFGLFDAMNKQLTLDLSLNSLSGSIPASLFSNVPLSSLTSLRIDLHANSLEYVIPAALFSSPLSSLSSLYIDLSLNSISGPASNLFTSGAFDCSTLTTVSIALHQNFRLSGPVPNWFTTNCASMTSFSLLLSDNRLTGTLPAGLFSGAGFSSSLTSFDFDVATNQLEGTIPPLDLSGVSLASLSLVLSSNLLTGTLPSNMFASFNWATLSTFVFDVSSNQLSGNVPSVFFKDSTTPATGLSRYTFSNNKLMTGTLPSAFIPSLLTSTKFSSPSVLYLTIDLSHTGLTGTIQFTDTTSIPQTGSALLQSHSGNVIFNNSGHQPQVEGSVVTQSHTRRALVAQTLRLNFLASDANFSSLQAPALNPSYLIILDLSNNYGLSGTFPTFLNNFPSGLEQLYLTNTSIRFCSDRAPWTSSALQICHLYETEAYYCDSYYPSNCATTKPSRSSSSTACSQSSRPSTDWTCSGSTWVYYGSYNGTTLTIPSGNSEAIVIGNVSSTNVIMQSYKSSLTLEAGCVTNLSSVTIELSTSDLSELSTGTSTVLLSSYGGSGCTDLNTVNLLTTDHSNSCKKVTVKKQTDGFTLSALFSIDNSGCHHWWIILVAVLASLVVAVVIIFILLVVFVPAVRHFVRPYSKPRAATGAV